MNRTGILKPLTFRYRYRLSTENGATIVGLDAEVDLGRAALLGLLVRRAVQGGVDANLAALKTILEASP